MRTRSPKASTFRSRALTRASRIATPGLFGLWLVGLCTLYLGVAESREGHSVAQGHEGQLVAHSEPAAEASTLMSCAEEPSSSNEPLWCAHPDSPHCTRGTPAPSNAESWLGPVFASTPVALALPTLIIVPISSAPSPAALLGYAQSEAERLERPPRQS
jgi:hypothetical protein